MASARIQSIVREKNRREIFIRGEIVTNPLALMNLVNRALGRGRSFFEQRLREHFGEEPKALSTLAESVDKPDYPNLHLAIQSFLAKSGRSGELLGILGLPEHSEVSLSALLAAPSPFMTPPSPGPVQIEPRVEVDDHHLPAHLRDVEIAAADWTPFARSGAVGDRAAVRVDAAERQQERAIRCARELEIAPQRHERFSCERLSFV